MTRKRLLWKVAPPYLAITILAVIATGWLSMRSLRNFYLQHIREDLQVQAQFALRELPGSFPDTNPDSLEQLCRAVKENADSRLTLVAKDGRVLGDSDVDPRITENHASHPEVHRALAGDPSFDVRYSITVHRTMMYYALPVRRGGEIIGVLRTSLPLTSFESALSELASKIAIGILLVVLAAAFITYGLSKRVSRPIISLVEGAQRYATGDLSRRLEMPDTVELATLAEALNRMAAELDNKIRDLTAQRNEQQSVLSSMAEGVIAVRSDERILFMNRAAQDLLQTDAARAKGRLVPEYVRSSELQQFIRQMLTAEEIPAAREIMLPTRANQVLQVSGSLLRDPNGASFGVLVVLNDITRLRQLEGLRKEFVANVSHELKTPITAIKGFVETLREGAIEDKEYAQTFLERLGRNVERLEAIVDDLLNLSRIERDVDQAEVKLLPGDVGEIVRAAVAACAPLADEKQIRLLTPRLDDVTAQINVTLLEQAVVNLLDNAIKYSEPERDVDVQLIRASDHAEIRVRDHGVGIAEEHLPRLFERFYRVDKARSRKLGGTGLGLAIVKHIVQAHNGRVTVESEPGVGSTFTISLPVA